MNDSKVVIKGLEALVLFCTENNDKPLWPSGPTGKEYLEGIVRVSPEGEARGSYVKGLDSLEKTVEFLTDLDWKQIEVSKEVQHKQSQYFQAVSPPWCECFENIARLGDVDDVDKVQIRDGSHGDELVVTTEGGKQPTEIISTIVEDGMMSTWYPGQFTARSPETIPLNREEWNKDWAVKLI